MEDDGLAALATKKVEPVKKVVADAKPPLPIKTMGGIRG